VMSRRRDEIAMSFHKKHARLASSPPLYTAQGITERQLDEAVQRGRNDAIESMLALGQHDAAYICQQFSSWSDQRFIKEGNTIVTRPYPTQRRVPLIAVRVAFGGVHRARAHDDDIFDDDDADLDAGVCDFEAHTDLELLLPLAPAEDDVIDIDAPPDDARFVHVPTLVNGRVFSYRMHKSTVLSMLSATYGTPKQSNDRLARVRQHPLAEP